MKILMLGWELPPYNSGGLGVACYQLAQALADDGVQIKFVLPSHAQHDDPDFMEVVQPAPSQPTTKSMRDRLDRALNPYTANIDEVRELQREYDDFIDTLISKDRPTVIHANDWLTLEAGVRAKMNNDIPLIAHIHATEFDRAGGGIGNPLIHEIEQHGLMMADHIIAVSQATKNIIVEKYHIPEEKIEVIHNSAEVLPEHVTDIAEYRYVEYLKREGYIIVATIGRLTLQKGLGYFLRAAAKAYHKHSRFVFLVTGDGEQRDELIALSADLGVSDAVIFTGFVRGKAWRDVYNLADVFVMSSVSEPFGLTALEAAQHRTAITITHQSGVSEVLSNVLRYDYWDEDRLADQLVAIALSPNLRNELANNVYHEVRQLTWKKVAERFTSRYVALGGMNA